MTKSRPTWHAAPDPKMGGIIVVRHAMPEVVPGTAANHWGLSESSREDCVLLAHALPARIESVWSSGERKARETADVLALRLGTHVSIHAGFAEVDRPQVWDRDYRDVAAGYLSGEPEPGWEEHTSVIRRFGEAVGRATGGSKGEMVVVTHGLAMTLWISSKIDIPAVQWWRALTLPDAWRLDAAAGTLERLWMGGKVAG